ncbi:MAG: BON domain-containing protein [Deltaproteobacteria bacterium]|nr:BON domain-containing protein [Deltaproteobacteria bacterium]
MTCITSMMQQQGASAEAINFTKMMRKSQKNDADAVYMSQFRKMGRVDLAETVTPTWNSPVGPGFILVNGSPEVVQLWDNVKDIDIKKDSLYPTIVSRFPKTELWTLNWFNGMQPLPSDGQRFVFSFILMNGCRACDIAGAAEFAFDFDGNGKFLGTRLVRLVDSEAAIASRSASASSGPAPSQPSDPVAKGIEEAFTRNAIKGLNILKTEEGVYRISGTVKNAQESDRVNFVASNVPGVKRVDRDFNFSDNTAGAGSQIPGPVTNAASVAPAAEPAAPGQSGDPVAGGIEQAFARNGIKGLNILKTEEGVFKISGQVKDNQEADRIVWVASNVPGVKRVDPDFNLPGNETTAASQVPGPVPNAAAVAPSVPAVPGAVPTMKDRIEAELALRGFPGVFAWVAGNGSVRISDIEKYPGQTDTILSIASAVSGSADVQVLKLPTKKKQTKHRRRNHYRGGSIAPPDRDF